MSNLSNQYAAMPSLHFGWSMWCCIALVPTFRSRIIRGLLIVYPWLTLFAIVVTANHYWLDALGGAWVLLVGYLIGVLVTGVSPLPAVPGPSPHPTAARRRTRHRNRTRAGVSRG
jgi:hypothetical protein